MPLTERNHESAPPPATVSTEEGPALRDAALVAERVARDEAEAAAIRERSATAPPALIVPDKMIGPLVRPGERVHGLRSSAMLMSPGDERAYGYGGCLYLTSQRLVHVGQVIVTVELDDIAEVSRAGDRLLLTLRAGDGMALDVERPRSLRAEMAAVMRGRRR
jgi:hypothetical protein